MLKKQIANLLLKIWSPISCRGSELKLIEKIRNCGKSIKMWNSKRKREMSKEIEEKKYMLNILSKSTSIEDWDR